MSDVVRDFIAAETAALVRLVPPVIGTSLGFGTDLSCTSDLTPEMKELDPNSPQGIFEMLVRFLTSERNSIPDAPGRGRSLYHLIARGLTRDQIRSELQGFESEALQDDRIGELVTTIEYDGRSSFKIRMMITPADPTLQPFEGVFGIVDGASFSELLSP